VNPERRVHRRWQSSLYARAGLFVALGAASFVGAVAVLSRAMVDESVDRLLSERLELARTIGAFIETRMINNLGRLGSMAGEKLDQRRPVQELGQALDSERRTGIYREAAFVLDARGQLMAAVPTEAAQWLGQLPLAEMVTRSQVRMAPVNSSVVAVGAERKPVVALVEPIRRGKLGLGYVGGVLAVGQQDTLGLALRSQQSAATVVDIVDAKGTVLASSAPQRLMLKGDHDEVLADAIASGRALQGRCHGCHQEQGEAEPEKVQTVLAFARMPNLDLGISVQQPEDEALAPAFALQRRLIVLGLGMIALFLIFAGLAVRSIVDPIKRLTREVRAVDAAAGSRALPAFGHDEMGVLAGALERWRTGMIDSLAAAENHRAALHTEMAETRKLLGALEEIASQYRGGADASGILHHGLGLMLRLLGMGRGVIRVTLGDQELVARWQVPESEVSAWLAQCPGPVLQGLGCEVRETPVAPGESAPLVCAYHAVPNGIRMAVALGERQAPGETRWLGSLVHQLGVSATTRLLHDQQQAHQQQQEQYLHRVMRAQEDERRRVARELHDTVAQDLAALRLEVERICARVADPEMRRDLEHIEQHAAEVLAQVRRTLFDLRLTVLENLGLVATLQWHLERIEKEQGIRGILAVSGPEREPPYQTAVALFRIFQESLQNVVSHARADHVTVTLTFAATQAKLEVEDDGIGFDVDSLSGPAAESGRGLGLLGMQERARLVGGQVSTQSEPGEGTTVSVSVPLPAISAPLQEESP
jgi:signal transduction histidine kinase